MPHSKECIKCGFNLRGKIIALILCTLAPVVAFGYLPEELTLTADNTAATVVSSPSFYQAFDLSFTGINGLAPKLAVSQLSGFDPKIQRLLTFNYTLSWKFQTGSTRAFRNESLQNIPILLQVEWVDGSTTRTVDAGILFECSGWRDFQVDLQSVNAWFNVPLPVTLKLKFVTPDGVDVTDCASLQIRNVGLKSNKYQLGLDANLVMARMGIQYFSDYYRLTIQGTNPYIATSGLNAAYDPEEHYVLSFDYRKGSANDFSIDYFRIFFWDYPNNSIDGSDYITGSGGTATANWQTATIYLKNSAHWPQGFNQAGINFSRLRIDFGSGSNVGNMVDIRNIRLRRDFTEILVDETKATKDLSINARGMGNYTLLVSSVASPDPWLFMQPLEYSDGGYYLDPNNQVYLTFDYSATKSIQNFVVQGYYGDSRDSAPPVGTYGKQLTACLLPATVNGDPNYVGTPWKTVALPLEPIDYYNNGLDAGDRIRYMQFHFGDGAANQGNQIMIRRIRLTRAPEKLWDSYSEAKKNNMRIPDLSDINLTGQSGNRLPLTQLTNATTSFVQRAIQKININGTLDYEAWEKSRYTGVPADSAGYPTVVKNIHGAAPDGRFYLYYAHHNPTSGIGCMVSSGTSPSSAFARYNRLATDDAALKSWGNTSNSLVLEAYFNGDYVTGSTSNYTTTTGDPRHFSSPCVVWSREDNLWFMYFHYYDPYPAGQAASGDQKTGLAFCADLSLNRWYILRDGTALSSYIRPVLPAFPEASQGSGNQSWITSQSTYHYIAQLPSGQWLAFLRGTTEYSGSYTKIGIATSSDGINWHYLPEGSNGSGNPVISQNDGLTPGSNRGTGNYRPHFMLYLSRLNSSEPLITLNNLYQGVWSEAVSGDSNLKLISGKTQDTGTSAYLFPTEYRASTSEYLNIQAPSASQLGTGQDGVFAMDGSFSPLRVGSYLYIFIGKDLYKINLESL